MIRKKILSSSLIALSVLSAQVFANTYPTQPALLNVYNFTFDKFFTKGKGETNVDPFGPGAAGTFFPTFPADTAKSETIYFYKKNPQTKALELCVQIDINNYQQPYVTTHVSGCNVKLTTDVKKYEGFESAYDISIDKLT